MTPWMSASQCVHLEHDTGNQPAWLFGWRMERPVPYVIVCFLARSAKHFLAKETCQHCASLQGHSMRFCLGFPMVEKHSKRWMHSHIHQCWLNPWSSFLCSSRPWLQDGQSWSEVDHGSKTDSHGHVMVRGRPCAQDGQSWPGVGHVSTMGSDGRGRPWLEDEQSWVFFAATHQVYLSWCHFKPAWWQYDGMIPQFFNLSQMLQGVRME